MRREFWRFTNIRSDGEEQMSILYLVVQEDETVVMMRAYADQLGLAHQAFSSSKTQVATALAGQELSDMVVAVPYATVHEHLLREGGTKFDTEEEARA
jgi:hypothetical protein